MRTPRSRRSSSPTTPAQAAASSASAPGNAELLDLDQAIARLATTRPTFYRWLHSGRIKGLKVGRQWRFRPQDIENLLNGTVPAEALAIDMAPLLGILATRLRETGDTFDPSLADNPVEGTVSLMIRLGVALRASSLHLELQHEQPVPRLRLRYRIDGVLHECAYADRPLLAPLIQYWKRMADLDLNEQRLPQDGRVLDSTEGRQIDMRVSFLPVIGGESMTVRFLSRGMVPLTLADMSFSPHNRTLLETAMEQRWGLIVCSGPSGSGKTSTMYACLTHVAQRGVKVLSVEDPVEFSLPGVTQMPLPSGYSFAPALRATLRGDPDVLFAGELRDHDTMQVCIQAAITGRLVLTSLHTPDAASTLQRMIEIGGIPWMVTETTRLVIGQRLVRRLCPHCSKPVQLDQEQEVVARTIANEGGLDFASLPREYRQSSGCAKCGQTGFLGRIMICEMLNVDPEIGAALRRNAPVTELRRLAVAHGMVTMAADGLSRATRGETSIEELRRNIPCKA